MILLSVQSGFLICFQRKGSNSQTFCTDCDSLSDQDNTQEGSVIIRYTPGRQFNESTGKYIVKTVQLHDNTIEIMGKKNKIVHL